MKPERKRRWRRVLGTETKPNEENIMTKTKTSKSTTKTKAKTKTPRNALPSGPPIGSPVWIHIGDEQQLGILSRYSRDGLAVVRRLRVARGGGYTTEFAAEMEYAPGSLSVVPFALRPSAPATVSAPAPVADEVDEEDDHHDTRIPVGAVIEVKAGRRWELVRVTRTGYQEIGFVAADDTASTVKWIDEGRRWRTVKPLTVEDAQATAKKAEETRRKVEKQGQRALEVASGGKTKRKRKPSVLDQAVAASAKLGPEPEPELGEPIIEHQVFEPEEDFDLRAPWEVA